MAYTAKVVDVDGTVFGTLSDAARIGPIVEELNAPGGVTITLPTTHTDAALMLPGREIQILDGEGDVVFWGPIVRPQAGLVESTWQCQGLLWYFQHRYMGTADRTDLLSNGDFEDGETDWSFVNSVGHSIETSAPYVLDGTQSLELNGTTADHTQHATQTINYTTQYHPLGDAVFVTAWVYIPNPGYLGGALGDRGLMAIKRDSGGTTLTVGIATIGDDTEKNDWVQLEVVVPGAHAGDTIEVRLYPPHGTAFFDDVTATQMESLAFDKQDVGVIIGGIVDYAQDNYPGFTHGKSDLNIVADADTTGTIATRVYQFAEHRNIGDALEEFTRQGVVDFAFDLTTTTRTLRAYVPPTEVTYETTLDLAVNLAGMTWSWDGDRAATSVVVLGPGDGPDRPEGGAFDSSFLGGLTLEIVESAPEDVTIGELDDRAAQQLAVAKAPEILEVTTLPGAGIVGNLHPGDIVPVSISHGWVDIDDNYRAARVATDCYTDQATITLNRFIT